MAKYHISSTTGRPNLCSASVRACPHGGEDEHFGSKDEARKAFESKMAESSIPAGVSNRDAALAASWVKPKSWQGLPDEVTAENLRAAMAHAKATGDLTPVFFQETDNQKAKSGYLRGYDHSGDYEPSSWRMERRTMIATPAGELHRVVDMASLENTLDDGEVESFPQVLTTVQKMKLNSEGLAEEDSTTPPVRVFLLDGEIEKISGEPIESNRFDSMSAAAVAVKAMRENFNPYVFTRLAVAKEESTSSRLINSAGYAGAKDERIRAVVASHPRLSPKSRKSLALDGSHQVASAVAQRSDLTSSEFKAILDHSYEAGHRNRQSLLAGGFNSPRGEAMRNVTLPAPLMASLARKATLEDLKILGQNRALTAEAKAIGTRRLSDLGIKVEGFNQ